MSIVYWEDSTSASGLQPGQFGYAGYFNGPFANLTSIHDRFPSKPVMGYATRLNGSFGADAVDCEPGTLGSSFASNAAGAVTFVKQWGGGSKLFGKPVVYCMASWQGLMESYLAANGIPRSRYYLNSSHATGRAHFCGPNTCGYGHTQADATQFLFAHSYDQTVMQAYMLGKAVSTGGGGVIVSVDGSLISPGDYGSAVLHVAQRLFNLGYLPHQDISAHYTFMAFVAAFQKARGLASDGIIGPLTWAELKKNNPPSHVPAPPPAVFTYSAPQHLTVTGGRTSFKANWNAPVNAPSAAGTKYELYVYEGLIPKTSNLVPTYPRHVGHSVAYLGGGLKRKSQYTIHVVAGEGTEVRPLTYASATFRTS